MKKRVEEIVFILVVALFVTGMNGCVQDGRTGRFSAALRGIEIAELLREFQEKDLGEFYEKLSETHKIDLVKESLRDRYVAGVSYPFEFVYYHRYCLIRKDGSLVEYVDYAARANTPEAVRTLGEQHFLFQAGRERVEILKASVYSGDGQERETETSSVIEKEPFTGLVYSDLRIKSLSLKGLSVGSVLRIVVKVSDRRDGKKRPFFREVDLDHYVPVKEKLHLFRFEAGTDYRKRERIRAETAPFVVSRSLVSTQGDSVHLYLRMGGKTEIPEPVSIPVQEYDSRVYFFTPTSWDEAARQYFTLSNPKVSVTEEIAKKARLLSEPFSERREKIRAIYNYVKGLRYVAILLNRHEIVPHDAGLTFRNGYGDCKDKSVLLMAMLKAIGIDSSIALVNTDYLIDQEVCSLAVFNHAIVAVPEKDGGYLFLDATGSYTPFGLLPRAIQHRHALVVGEKGGQLLIIPSDSPEQNRVEETIEVVFHDLREATVNSRSRTLSSNEIYHQIAEFPQNVLRQFLEQLLSTKHKEVQILHLHCAPADDQGVLVIDTKVRIKDFTKRMGSAYAFNPLVEADALRPRDVVALTERKTEIELDGPQRLVAEITIHLPESAVLDAVPENRSIRNEKFGEYTYTITRDGNTLRLRRDVRLTVKRVPVADYPAFRDFYQACLRQDEEMVLLKSKSPTEARLLR